MLISFLNKKNGSYKTLGLLNLLAIMVAPFINSHLFVVDNGGGTAGQQSQDEEKKQLLVDIQKLILDSTKENVNKKTLDERIEAINKMIEEAFKSNEEIKTLKESVDKLLEVTGANAAAIKAMSENPKVPGDNKVKTFKSALMDAIKSHPEVVKTKKDDNGERESLIDYIKSNQRTPEINIDKAVDMLESNIVQNNVANVRLTELDPERVGIPLTVYQHVIDVFPSSPISKPYMSLLVVYDYSDGAGTKTEGTAPTQSSFILKTVEFKAFDIATYFTLSDETLDDLPEAMDELGMVAPDKILASIDGKILRDGGNGTTDIKGLFVGADTCTDFVASAYASSTVGANKIDLISKMKLAIRKNKYAANFVGLNSTDIEVIQSEKDLLNNSIADKRLQFNVNGDLVKICGLTVFENDSITADTCIVGATNKLKIGIRKGSTMQIGYNGTDFTEGQKTVKVNMRLAFGVRDKAAFQYSAGMAADVETITKQSAG